MQKEKTVLGFITPFPDLVDRIGNYAKRLGYGSAFGRMTIRWR